MNNLSREELAVNQELQMTGAEKFVEGIENLGKLLNVKPDWSNPYWVDISIAKALGCVFDELSRVSSAYPNLVNEHKVFISKRENSYLVNLYDDEEPTPFSWEPMSTDGKKVRIPIRKPCFMYQSDFWEVNTSDAIVKYIASQLKMINTLLRVVIRYQALLPSVTNTEHNLSLARAKKAMAQLEILRNL